MANAILTIKADLKRPKKTYFECNLSEEIVHRIDTADIGNVCSKPSTPAETNGTGGASAEKEIYLVSKH